MLFVYKKLQVLFIHTYIFLESADEYLDGLHLNFQRNPRRFTVLNFRTTNNNKLKRGEKKQYLLNLLARMNKRRGTLLDRSTGFDHLEHPHIRLGQV